MTAATLDTNVLAAGFAGYAVSTSVPGAVLRAWRAYLYRLVVSEPILAELGRTLEKSYFRARLSPQEAADDPALLRKRAVVVALTTRVEGVATHAADDLVLATAVSAGSEYLVTGD